MRIVKADFTPGLEFGWKWSAQWCKKCPIDPGLAHEESRMMNREYSRRLKLILGIAVLVVAAGCVSSSEGRRMQQSIEALDARFTELNQSTMTDRQTLQDLIPTAQAAIQRLRTSLEEAQSILRRSNTDVGSRLDQYTSEVQGLRGQIEQLDFRLNQLQEQLTLFMEDIDIRLRRR